MTSYPKGLQRPPGMPAVSRRSQHIFFTAKPRLGPVSVAEGDDPRPEDPMPALPASTQQPEGGGGHLARGGQAGEPDATPGRSYP